VFGSKLKEQVEDRLKFYETGLILFYIAKVLKEPEGSEAFTVGRCGNKYTGLTELNSEKNKRTGRFFKECFIEKLRQI
jgi:hypothetical protein